MMDIKTSLSVVVLPVSPALLFCLMGHSHPAEDWGFPSAISLKIHSEKSGQHRLFLSRSEQKHLIKENAENVHDGPNAEVAGP
jgi:hypothetical protein